MRYIRTPTGEVYKYDECEDFENDFCETIEVFFIAENQKKLAEELFEQTGILIADEKGGENDG